MSSEKDVEVQGKDAYPLNRDLLASARLNLQHQLWISSLGYHLHPSIPLEENTLIAEIGCGTGIFALEMAKQLPLGSQVEAYDLNLAQCPPRGWSPVNVIFKELDIYDEVPQHLIGRYNVVCLRHFICVVQSGDPIPLLTALLKLLKPGGYLQWQEYDLQTNKLVVSEACHPAEQLAPELKRYMDSITGSNSLLAHVSWVKNFHTCFTDTDVELIAHHRLWTAKEARLIKQETSFLTAREWIENQRARDPSSLEATRLEQLTNAAQEECWRLQRGTFIDTEMVTWVARKKETLTIPRK